MFVQVNLFLVLGYVEAVAHDATNSVAGRKSA